MFYNIVGLVGLKASLARVCKRFEKLQLTAIKTVGLRYKIEEPNARTTI